MAGFDPAKAAEYNRLIQQGVKPEQAIAQAGITDEESGNYQINSVGTPETNRDYGKMSAMTVGQGKEAGVDYDRAPADPLPTGSAVVKTTYTETSTETVSGGGSTTVTVGPRIPTAASQAYAEAGAAKQTEIDNFIKNNPSNFARARQGLPPLSPEENEARNAELNRLQDQRSQLYNQQYDSETPSAPTVTRIPNTTTTTSTTTVQQSSSRAPVNFDQDESLNQQTETQLETTTTRAKGTSARDNPVNPASDPSQFPAYDDEGNLMPGYGVNNETGQTYYKGITPNTTNTGVNPAIDPSQFPHYDDEGNLMPGYGVNDETGQTYYIGPDRSSNSGVQANQDAYINGLDLPEDYQVAALSASSVNDPYSGLTQAQIESLGGADPTDPYIRARLGIPQLPGSTLFATGGFGTIKTGVPAIDSALGIITGIGSLFSNFASTIGGLFGPKVEASAQAATTGSGVAGLAVADTGPAKTNTAVTPTADPSQFPAYDDEGNLQPGFAINDETGQTYYKGLGPPTEKQAVTPTADPSQFPAYDDDGNLQPGFAINDETGQTYYKGLEPPQGEQAVNPASDPSQFPHYDDEGNLMPGYAVNDETGQTYYRGFDQPTGTDATTLSADQADAFYNGTGTPTASERAATDAQTAKDSAELYPGTKNTNLKNINEASAAIAQNEAGIANAKDIIAKNNEELADPNISDERRAELEANNAAQENYIRLAEDNTAENELVIEANADAFAAGGGEPGSGQGPDEVAALEDPALEEQPVDEDIAIDAPEDLNPDADADIAAQEPQAEEGIFADAAQDINPEDDPFEAQRLEAEARLDEIQPELAPEDVALMTDAEADALDEQQAENRRVLAEEATDVEPGLFAGQTDEFGGVDEAIAAQQAEDVDQTQDALLTPDGEEEGGVTADTGLAEPEDVDANEDEGLALPPGAEEDGPPQEEPYALNPDEDEAIAQQEGGEEEANGEQEQAAEDQFQGSQEAAVKAAAQAQATIQARFKQNGNRDWRFRLSLSPNANYLYNAGTPRGTGAGILAPLAATDGVIFPYTPQITLNYTANYEQYDLVHSNFRGVFYKNSRVGDISLRGTFTAQDTTEANYLLAVIHFFRSATKMFYGQDAERGTPPPLCLLNGLGTYQFNNHPVVISSFNYSTPNDVDYIRAGDFNNFGLNMLNRRAAVAANPGGQNLAGLFRLANAALQKGAPGTNTPAPGSLNQQVTNTTGSSYVPTKMEIDITLIPVQTRNKVSNQFSLKGFANGDLLKGGFW